MLVKMLTLPSSTAHAPQGCLPELSRVVWAVVHMKDGRTVGVVSALVWWPLPQTSQCAEWCAMGVATEVRCSTNTIYSDCAAVVRGCDRGESGLAMPDHSKKVHGATARQVCYRLRGRHDVSVEKCRAHQAQPEQGTLGVLHLGRQRHRRQTREDGRVLPSRRRPCRVRRAAD